MASQLVWRNNNRFNQMMASKSVTWCLIVLLRIGRPVICPDYRPLQFPKKLGIYLGSWRGLYRYPSIRYMRPFIDIDPEGIAIINAGYTWNIYAPDVFFRQQKGMYYQNYYYKTFSHALRTAPSITTSAERISTRLSPRWYRQHHALFLPINGFLPLFFEKPYGPVYINTAILDLLAEPQPHCV